MIQKILALLKFKHCQTFLLLQKRTSNFESSKSLEVTRGQFRSLLIDASECIANEYHTFGGALLMLCWSIEATFCIVGMQDFVLIYKLRFLN